jgi:hypothetical protein
MQPYEFAEPDRISGYNIHIRDSQTLIYAYVGNKIRCKFFLTKGASVFIQQMCRDDIT